MARGATGDLLRRIVDQQAEIIQLLKELAGNGDDAEAPVAAGPRRSSQDWLMKAGLTPVQGADPSWLSAQSGDLDASLPPTVLARDKRRMMDDVFAPAELIDA